jgi:hypothetical protein
MRARRLLATIVLSLFPAVAIAGGAQWRRYVIPSTSASVDVPVAIFSEVLVSQSWKR